MITLQFVDVTSRARLELGPLPSFRLQGEAIIGGAADVLAHQSDSFWKVGEMAYHRLDCEGPLRIEPGGCTGEVPVLGPFWHFSLVDGTAFADRELFARFDQVTGGWYLYATDHECSSLTVASAR